jgi:hypothetical protein
MGREADFTFIDYSYNELIQSAINEGFKENTKILKGMVKSEME